MRITKIIKKNRIPCENNETHGNHRISLDNHNKKQLNFVTFYERIKKLMKIIESELRIIKIMKTYTFI